MKGMFLFTLVTLERFTAVWARAVRDVRLEPLPCHTVPLLLRGKRRRWGFAYVNKRGGCAFRLQWWSAEFLAVQNVCMVFHLQVQTTAPKVDLMWSGGSKAEVSVPGLDHLGQTGPSSKHCSQWWCSEAKRFFCGPAFRGQEGCSWLLCNVQTQSHKGLCDVGVWKMKVAYVWLLFPWVEGLWFAIKSHADTAGLGEFLTLSFFLTLPLDLCKSRIPGLLGSAQARVGWARPGALPALTYCGTRLSVLCLTAWLSACCSSRFWSSVCIQSSLHVMWR